jgi:DNA processing protein
MGLTTEQREWLTLAMVPGVGTGKFIQLLARFRTPGSVLGASRTAIESVVGPALAKRISTYSEAVDVAAQERAMHERGAKLITLDDTHYPTRLAEIYDPPLVLFTRGALLDQDEHCVAIVGTRRPTPYGIRMAERFGRELAARGVTVVSGLAAGIDTAAHRGAIEAGGRTIAVLGCGVDVVYPKQNAGLYDAIAENGVVMTQFAMGTEPRGTNFPVRNRIISGLSLGTLVVEAPVQSGALITARQAAEQGREVFAVPGQLDVRTSAGPHALIREGAKLVETVEDIILELQIPAQVRQAPAPPPPTETQSAAPQTAAPSIPEPNETNVLRMLSPNGSHIDEIATACRMSVSEALSSLTLLELKGLVRQFSGKRFAPR